MSDLWLFQVCMSGVECQSESAAGNEFPDVERLHWSVRKCVCMHMEQDAFGSWSVITDLTAVEAGTFTPPSCIHIHITHTHTHMLRMQ